MLAYEAGNNDESDDDFEKWEKEQEELRKIREGLIKEEKREARVGILTDFDASGVQLAFTIKNVKRLGVGLDTIDKINAQRGKDDEILDPLKLLENYNGATHWISLNNLTHGISKPRGTHTISEIEGTDHELEYKDYLNQEYKFSDGTTQTYIEFIKNRRIELNTIVDEIGAQRFWNWLKSKILEIFPDRDYNRAINVPQYVLTPTMTAFQQKLIQSVTGIASPMVDDIKYDLESTEGLLDIYDTESEIKQELLDSLLDEPEIQKIDVTLKRLLKL